MIVERTVESIMQRLSKERDSKRTIGLVPTMGYFHEGHLSLIRRACEESDIVVVSIFVNPTQFSPAEDFEAYPRDLKRDEALAKEAGADYIFAPDAGEIYPDGFSTFVDVEGPATRGLCAKARPGHFRGVATVCAKLFNIVKPDAAYFGQKDFQQTAVIKKMVRDLNMSLEIIVCPTVRETDGLAMSSRNTYLSTDERKAAVSIYESLARAEMEVARGVTDVKELLDGINDYLAEESLVELEYASVCDTIDLGDLESVAGDAVIAIAAKVGKTRLIDNIIVNRK